MIWLQRRFSKENWAHTDLMERVERLQMMYPREFMMVEEEHAVLDSTIWVRLPTEQLTSLFPGFTPTSAPELAKRPILLAAENNEFEAVFGSLPKRRTGDEN